MDLEEFERSEMLGISNGLILDSQLKKLAKTLSQIVDDSTTPAYTRLDTLDRISRYVDSAKKHSIKDDRTGELKPVVSQYMIVRVNFAGLGSELDNIHYGIVWNADRKRDHISIIPTTSFKPASTLETGETFNIGKVGFLSGETVVLMNQITSVSRKRIRTARHFNPTSDKKELVKLSLLQQKRVMEGFRIYGLKEESLSSKYIRNSFSDRLPMFDDPELQYQHLHRPIIEIENTKDLVVYRLYDSEQEFNLHRKPFQLMDSTRNNVIKDWVEAKAIWDPDTETFVKERDEVRKDAYIVIQDAIEKFVTSEIKSDEVTA
ncbi:hypothetical protein [Paenibacillus macquariensis]|uniref:hypothetical protein n=1 Tax=Paenibacillus macquariensis TaxID=948756 RepID=UPI0011154FC6|nr:hypothetical protein [Paenibacillus macquariensis]